MSRPSTIAFATLIVGVLTCAQATAQPTRTPQAASELARAADDPHWRVDARGRVFRTGFPRHDRLFAGYGVQAGPGGAAEHTIGAGLKTGWGLDFAEENIWWQLRHTFADVRYATDGQAAGDGRLYATVASGRYLRHDDSAFVVVPVGDEDLRLPAPFDIAVEWRLGAGLLSLEEGPALEAVDAASVAVLADLVRDPDYRHRLAVGVVGDYRLELDEPPTTHHLAPLTGVAALWSWEDRRGLIGAELGGRCASELVVGDGGPTGWQWSCSAVARAEWTPVAINDQPVSLPVEWRLGRRPGEPAAAPDDWQVSVGVRVSLPEPL